MRKSSAGSHDVVSAAAQERDLSLEYDQAFRALGYPSTTISHNYWEETPAVTVENPDVKWLHLTHEKAPKGLLPLQSYTPDAITTTVSVPGFKQLVDAETKEVFLPGGSASADIPLAANYGTQILLVSEETGMIGETHGWP